MIETLDDIVEPLADKLSVYGSHQEDPPSGPCRCRVCFVSDMKARITRAVEIERKLSA